MKVLVLLLLFASVASAQIKTKVQFSTNATTTWAAKDFSAVQPFQKIKGYYLINDSSTLTDTIWVGHQYNDTRIDTSSTYRTPILGGEAFGLTGVLLDDIWVKSSSGTIAYRLLIY